jgi:hypothetical protein
MKNIRPILLGMAAVLAVSACGTATPTAPADAFEVRSGAVFSTGTTTSFPLASPDSGAAQPTAERGGLMFGSGH